MSGEVTHASASQRRNGAIAVGVVVLVPPRFERTELRGHDDVGGDEVVSYLVGEGSRGVSNLGQHRTNIGSPEFYAEHGESSL